MATKAERIAEKRRIEAIKRQAAIDREIESLTDHAGKARAKARREEYYQQERARAIRTQPREQYRPFLN